MNILITGATGMIGTAFVNTYKDRYRFGFVGRNIYKIDQHFSDIVHESYDWNMMQAEGAGILSQYDLVVNLVGENIGAKRWSSQQKNEIYNSRVDTTHLIATQAAASNNKSLRILNASAIGIYGFAGNIPKQNEVVYNEHSTLEIAPKSFLSQVGQAWEKALLPAQTNQIPVTKMRFGVVLSKNGGALPKMLPAFKLGLGSVLGSGKQPFTWIELSDLVRAIDFIINNRSIVGPINLVALDQINQRTFAKFLARLLGRPCFMKMPSVVVKALFGEMGEELLLNGQKVSCDHLLDAGFRFEYPSIREALSHILGADTTK